MSEIRNFSVELDIAPPFFTVVTICFNDLANLQVTALSVQAQQCKDYEWWIIDGGSTDGTPEWLETLSVPRLSWLSEPDKGLYHAMNKGMDRARGRYLIFMNSGDCFAGAEVLTHMKQKIEASPVTPVLAYGDSIDVASHEDVGRLRRARMHHTVEQGMFAQHQAMAFAATTCRHDERWRLSADYGFISTVIARAESTASILRLDFPVCRFLLGGLNETSRYKALKEDFQIRRDIIGSSCVRAIILYFAHWLHMRIKFVAPNLGKLLRR